MNQMNADKRRRGGERGSEQDPFDQLRVFGPQATRTNDSAWLSRGGKMAL